MKKRSIQSLVFGLIAFSGGLTAAIMQFYMRYLFLQEAVSSVLDQADSVKMLAITIYIYIGIGIPCLLAIGFGIPGLLCGLKGIPEDRMHKFGIVFSVIGMVLAVICAILLFTMRATGI